MARILEIVPGQFTVETERISRFTHQLHVRNDRVGLWNTGSKKYVDSMKPFGDWIDSSGSNYTSLSQLISDLSELFFDSALLISTSDILFNEENPSLLDGEEIETGFIDVSGVTGFLLNISSDTSGLTLVQTNRLTDGGDEDVITIPLPEQLTDLAVQFPARAPQIRFQIQNNSGSTINNVKVYLKNTQVQPTILPLAFAPLPQSQAILTNSVIQGSPAGDPNSFINALVNRDGALLTSDYGSEVAKGKFATTLPGFATGRNSEVGTGTVPEDVWNGGGIYTGFNCVAAERLEFFSSSATDVGQLLSSGTATGGSGTTLIDSSATFVTDGVSIGDLVINDTQQIHGVISSVDSETQLTVIDMTDDNISDFQNQSGDNYRIATALSTGAAVKKAKQLLDSNYDEFSEYIILNGLTSVLSVGEYLRHSESDIILSGANEANDGEITGRQSITTANVTMVMPSESGKTAICCRTVPRGQTWQLRELSAQMVRANGTPGSAGMRFQYRPRGEAWKTLVFPQISNSLKYEKKFEAGPLFTEFTDLKWNCQFVSDNGSILSADFEHLKFLQI